MVEHRNLLSWCMILKNRDPRRVEGEKPLPERIIPNRPDQRPDDRCASSCLPFECPQQVAQRLLDVLVQTVDPTRCKVALVRNGQRYRALAGAVGTQDRLAPLGVYPATTRK